MARLAVPRRLPVEEQQVLLACLGLHGPSQGGAWPAQQDIVTRLAVPRDTVQHVLQHARERWGRQSWMTELRKEVVAWLDKNGGVLTADELTATMLTARGSVAPDADRPRLAAALAAAAVETEMARAGARWDIVLQADAAPPDSRDWRNLQILVRRAMTAVEQLLFAADRPVLLVYPGLLARYDQISLLETLREACTQQQRHGPRLPGPGTVRCATHHARTRRQTRAGDSRF